jgi:CheY-like chemotaxis protein
MRKVPAIALTAHARAEDAARVVEAGFTIHLAKPVRPTALCAAIARVLGQRSR